MIVAYYRKFGRIVNDNYYLCTEDIQKQFHINIVNEIFNSSSEENYTKTG